MDGWRDGRKKSNQFLGRRPHIHTYVKTGILGDSTKSTHDLLLRVSRGAAAAVLSKVLPSNSAEVRVVAVVLVVAAAAGRLSCLHQLTTSKGGRRSRPRWASSR